ncbi:unnamed protein product, partial [Ceratitis capitata]
MKNDEVEKEAEQLLSHSGAFASRPFSWGIRCEQELWKIEMTNTIQRKNNTEN